MYKEVIKINKNSVQEWLPFEEIVEDGIIKLKNKSYVKILKINPINYNLKSDFEKETILNSYKLFLKTCNFDIQILIQSNKENLNEYINNIKNISKNKSKKMQYISDRYCQYIKNLNSEKNFSSKTFYILLKKNPEKININLIKEELNNDYFKVKECLARCGNAVSQVSTEGDVKSILYSFINSKDYTIGIEN